MLEIPCFPIRFWTPSRHQNSLNGYLPFFHRAALRNTHFSNIICMCVGTNVLSLNWNMPKTKSFHSSLRHRCICVSFRSFLLDIAIYVYCLRLKPLPVQYDRPCSTMASQAECKQFWLDAPKNRLCAWEVAKALGLVDSHLEPS